LVGSSKSWFLPYGVWLFALGGFASIPEARDIMKGATLADFKKVIVWSLLLSSLFYLIFIAAVLGVSGAATTEDALTGLVGRNGHIVILIGSLIGLIAVFTSYIALAADLQNIYIFDYGRSRFFSWLLAALAAPVLFVSGLTGLSKVLEVTGAVGLGVFGIFVIEMANRFHRIYPEHRHALFGPKKWLRRILIVCLLAGVFLEIANLLNLL
jgi:amino acid permease